MFVKWFDQIVNIRKIACIEIGEIQTSSESSKMFAYRCRLKGEEGKTFAMTPQLTIDEAKKAMQQIEDHCIKLNYETSGMSG